MPWHADSQSHSHRPAPGAPSPVEDPREGPGRLEPRRREDQPNLRELLGLIFFVGAAVAFQESVLGGNRLGYVAVGCACLLVLVTSPWVARGVARATRSRLTVQRRRASGLRSPPPGELASLAAARTTRKENET